MSDTPKTEGAPPVAAAPKEIPAVRGADYRVNYANHLRMRVGVADFGIGFGILDELPGVGPVGSEHSLIMMTPIVAKQLSMALTETLRAYEEKYGVITLTQEKPLDKAEILAAIAKGRDSIPKTKPAT